MKRMPKPKFDPLTPICRAVASTGRMCHCRALPGGEFCTNHDPQQAAIRKLNGRIRHPRFERKITVQGQEFARNTVPTMAKLVDELLDIKQAVKKRELAPQEASAMTSALRTAWQILDRERELQRKDAEAGNGPANDEQEVQPWMAAGES